MNMPVDPALDLLGLPNGYLIHGGYQLKCLGIEGMDADGSPILEQHLIGTLVMNPGTVDCIAIGNDSHDGQFQLESGQENFPTTLKCQCGQPAKL